MEETCSTETSVDFKQTTLRCIPEAKPICHEARGSNPGTGFPLEDFIFVTIIHFVVG
jgi:hypothetical protein